MKLTRFEINNYKCHKFTTLNLSDFHILIGKNNTGKTSIIECFKLMKEFFGKTVPDLRSAIFGGIKPNEIKDIIFTVVVELTDDDRRIYFQLFKLLDYEKDLLSTNFLRRIRMEFKIVYYPLKPLKEPKYQNQLFLSLMTISDRNQGELTILVHRERDQLEIKNLTNIERKTVEINKKSLEDWIQQNIGFEKKPLQDFHNQIIPQSPQRIIVQNFLDKLFFIESERDVIRTVEQHEAKNGGKEEMVERIHRFRNNEEEKYESIKDYGGDIQNDIGVLSTEILEDRKVTLRFNKGSKQKFKTYFLDQGKGIEHSLIFATYIPDSPTDSIWFIDEPELHQHPESQDNLYKLLIKLGEAGRQIIIATQSMIFLHKTDSARISLCSVDNEGVAKVINLDSYLSNGEDTTDKEREQIYLCLGYNPIFGFEPRNILLVEGLADKEIIRIFADTLELPLNNREVKIVPIGDSRKVERYASYISRALSGKKVFIVIDNDHKSPQEIKDKIMKLEKEYADYLNLNTILTEDNFYLYPEEVYSIEYYLLNSDAICKTCNEFDSVKIIEVKDKIEQKKMTEKPKEILKYIWEDVLMQGNYDELDTAVKIARNISKNYLQSFPVIMKLIKDLNFGS